MLLSNITNLKISNQELTKKISNIYDLSFEKNWITMILILFNVNIKKINVLLANIPVSRLLSNIVLFTIIKI